MKKRKLISKCAKLREKLLAHDYTNQVQIDLAYNARHYLEQLEAELEVEEEKSAELQSKLKGIVHHDMDFTTKLLAGTRTSRMQGRVPNLAGKERSDMISCVHCGADVRTAVMT